MQMLLVAVVALAVFVIVHALAGLLSAGAKARRERALERLKAAAWTGQEHVNILRSQEMSQTPWLNRLLAKLRVAYNTQRLLRQANLRVPVSVFLLGTALCGVVGFVLLRLAGGPVFASAAAGGGLAYVPVLLVRRRKKKRMAKFERQLPDGLDLIARALKAGHGFASGLRMAANEFHDPLGPEFAIVLDEINFGVDTDTALHNLTRRLDCPDLKFFVVSVNIQRETGGNLSDIVSNIAHLLRERFKLQGRVKVLSAEGRLAAWILLALPFVVAAAIKVLNPQYLDVLITHPMGRVMLFAAGSSMFLGFVVIKRLVVIKV